MEEKVELDKKQLHIETQELPKEEEILYCHCASPYEDDRHMIACDGCEQWFHGDCVGLTEEDCDIIDLYFCQQCEEQGLGKTQWKRKCFRNACTNLVSSLEPSKYCSDTCGLLVGKSRLKQLFNNQIASNVCKISFVDKPNRISGDLETRKGQHEETVMKLEQKLKTYSDDALNIQERIFYADCVSHVLETSGEEIAVPICGYVKHESFTQLTNCTNMESILEHRNLICMNPRNKCAQHGNIKIPLLGTLVKFEPSENHPLKSFTEDITSHSYTLPYWGILHANKSYVMHTDTSNKIAATKQLIEKLQEQLKYASNYEFDFTVNYNNKNEQSTEYRYSVISSIDAHPTHASPGITFNVGIKSSS